MNIELYDSTYTNNLGIAHLPRLWSKIKQQLGGKINTKTNDEWTKDFIVLDTLNLGTFEPIEFICNNNASLDEFENWVLKKNKGFISKDVIEKINKAILSNYNKNYSPSKKVLTHEDIEFFNTYGYVVVKNVISQDDCKKTIKVIGNKRKI